MLKNILDLDGAQQLNKNEQNQLTEVIVAKVCVFLIAIGYK